MNIDFEKAKSGIFQDLENAKHIVIATSSEGKVTARNISHIVLNDKILFQTDKNFEKIKQIEKNDHVALCVGNIQIVGVAKICGHPSESNNRAFLNKFKTIHIKSFNRYSGMADEVVVEVTPILITLWDYEDDRALRIFVDFEERIASKEYYDNSR